MNEFESNKNTNDENLVPKKNTNFKPIQSLTSVMNDPKVIFFHFLFK